MKVLRMVVVSLFLTGTFGGNAMASVVFDNALSLGDYGWDAVTHNPYASFSTGGSAFTLTDVEVFLYKNNPPYGTILANLYADNSASYPGALIGTVGSVAGNDRNFLPSGTAHWHTSYDLAANTRYWIGLSTTNSSTNEWAYVLGTDSTTGVIGEYRISGGQRYTNNATNGSLVMTLSGTEGSPSAVPEPSTYALLCIGLGVVGYARNRMTISRTESTF